MLRNFPYPTTVLIVAACLASAAVRGLPDPQDKRDSTAKPSGFILDPGEHELKDILERAAKFLGRNYVMPDKELAKANPIIELQKKLILDAVSCEEIVSQLAYTRGFVVVPIDPLRGLYEVVHLQGQRRGEVMAHAIYLTPDEVLRKARLKVYVMTHVPLVHLDAARAGQQLRPFFASSGHQGLQFGSIGNQRSLLLMGYADQVAAGIRLLREVEKPSQSRAVDRPSPLRETPRQPTRDPVQNLQGQLGHLYNTIREQGQTISKLQTQLRNLAAFVGEKQLSGAAGAKQPKRK